MLAKRAAHEFAKHREVELWRQEKLGERPRVTWDHTVIEWLKVHEHKRSIEDDRTRLRVLSEQLRGYSISQVTPERLRKAVESLPDIGYATRNRYMSVGSNGLIFAASVKWCSPPEKIPRFKEPSHRIRYLVPAEANRLLIELPDYTRPMVEFSLATGLRESNVRLLEWSNIDLERAIAWVHGDKPRPAKASRCRLTPAQWVC